LISYPDRFLWFRLAPYIAVLMPMTQKQIAALKAAPADQKARLKDNFLRDNLSKAQPMKPGPPAKPRQKAGQQVVARPPTRKAVMPRQLGWAFDAFDKRHMPLDEVTAPYTTTNFLSVLEFTSSAGRDQLIVVGPRTLLTETPAFLTDYIAVLYDASETLDGSISILDSVRSPIINTPALSQTGEVLQTTVRARLHNLSVRVECLGTNTGLYPPGSVYMGTVPNIENYSGNVVPSGLTLKTAWAEDSISVGYLRSISAVSLVTSPRTLHAAVAENVSYKTWRDIVVPNSVMEIGRLGFLTSLEPIVIYIPRAGSGNTTVNYRVNIAQQWCSRHPHNVMLRSTQVQHPPTSPDIWHAAISGVQDIGTQLLDTAGRAAMGMLRDTAVSYLGNPGAIVPFV
jgi:hypothetical protein